MEAARRKSEIAAAALRRLHMYPTNNERQTIDRILKNDLTCSICLEIFNKPHHLECGHMYCGSCISKWLREHRVCPMCRKPVTILQKPIECKVIENFIKEMVSVISPNNRRTTVEPKLVHKTTNDKNGKMKERPPWRF